MDQGILHQLKDMSQEDRRTFYRWLKANAVTGFMFAAALMAMAIIGSDFARPDEAAVAIHTNGSEASVTGGAATAHADEAAEPLYPGRHIASCKPAPIVGCLCETDTGHASIFPQSVSDASASDPAKLKRDDEYSQMVQWLRLTCQTIRR
jgi:hypothetical protein